MSPLNPRALRRATGGLAAAGALSLLLAGGAAAADDVAAAGNGGTATASANGGAVAIDDVDSGGNAGNLIRVGDTWGWVAVDGGDVASETRIGISADGGTAIADASGGDDNVAIVLDDDR